MRLRGHAGWLVLVWAVACSVYDESLLTISGADDGGGGSGSGTSGGGNVGSGGGGSAGTGGGSGGSGGSAGSAGSASAAAAGISGAADGGAGGQGPPPMLELIDDMEDVNTNVANIADRNGRWVTDNDGFGTTTPTKTMFALLVTGLTGEDARDGSSYGVRLRAEDFQGAAVGAWGAFVGLHFKAPDSTLYDATAYCGIHFWAKRSVDSSPILLEIRIPDQYTIPVGGFCIEEAAAAGGAGGSPGLCYDHHAAMLTLTAEWAEYSINFSDMQQGSWVGYEQSPLDGLDVSAITSIEFFLNRPMIYDLWVDDISFINKPAGSECP